MKAIFITSLIVLCSVNFAIIFYEYTTATAFKSAIFEPTMGLPVDSKTLKIAGKDKMFQKAEFKAVNKRLKRIKDEVIRNILILVVSLLFLSKNLRRKLINFSGHRITIVMKEMTSEKTEEINYICIMAILLGMIVYGDTPGKLINEKNSSFLLNAILYFLIFFFILPLMVLLVIKILKAYKSSFIIICYIAYFLKTFSELVTDDDVNLEQMKKISSEGFSQPLQDLLKRQGLDDKIYQEKVKSKSINAALVGWGSGERIEIYGDHEDFTDSEFESVLIHEIGHSQNYSLIKKILALFTIKFAEMIILLIIYNHLAKHYADTMLSISGAFMVLYLLYLVFGKKWIMIFHKLTSHYAETSADLTAKMMGYGGKLSKVLYSITIKSGDYIYSSYLYNLVRSYHPTIFDRIEYLN